MNKKELHELFGRTLRQVEYCNTHFGEEEHKNECKTFINTAFGNMMLMRKYLHEQGVI